MKRRDFLMTAAGAGAAGVALPGSAAAGPSAPRNPGAGAPPVLKSHTAEEHRRRLENIRRCEQSIRKCMRGHLVTDYLPAHATYNLGEYPSRVRWEPNDYDEEELDRLRDHGIQIIQVFDDWNDSLRLFGGDKYSPVNPEGFRRFVDMVHRRGMKLLPYVSTGFLQRTDPDFRREWKQFSHRVWHRRRIHRAPQFDQMPQLLAQRTDFRQPRQHGFGAAWRVGSSQVRHDIHDTAVDFRHAEACGYERDPAPG